MTSVKSWAAVATLVAVILGAFGTGSALTRIARHQNEQPMRMDQAARASAFNSDNSTTLDGNADPILSENGDFQGRGEDGFGAGNAGFGEGEGEGRFRGEHEGFGEHDDD